MEKFSVCQFFRDGTYEYVRRFTDAEDAVRAFGHYTNNVASRMGWIERVVVVDGGDCTNLEWVAGKGIVYPPDLNLTKK